MRELILYIAFKACAGRDLILARNPFQYRNATILIAVIFIEHIIQILLLTTSNTTLSLKGINEKFYFILLVSFFILAYLSTIVFSKTILAKSIKKYKETSIGNYAKLISFGYFFFNLIVIIIIALLRN